MKLGIVATSWYAEDMLDPMVELAEKTLNDQSVEFVTVRVPGSYDLPLAVKKLLKKPEIDGVVTLGALVKGRTMHDEAIMNALAPALTGLSLEFEKPVVLGVNGPGMTHGDGVKRVPRAAEVTQACIDMVKTVKEL